MRHRLICKTPYSYSLVTTQLICAISNLVNDRFCHAIYNTKLTKARCPRDMHPTTPGTCRDHVPLRVRRAGQNGLKLDNGVDVPLTGGKNLGHTMCTNAPAEKADSADVGVAKSGLSMEQSACEPSRSDLNANRWWPIHSTIAVPRRKINAQE